MTFEMRETTTRSSIFCTAKGQALVPTAFWTGLEQGRRDEGEDSNFVAVALR